MNIVEMRNAIGDYRKALKKSAGSVVEFSEHGPAGMVVIDALVQLVEAHERRLTALERKLKDLERRGSAVGD